MQLNENAVVFESAVAWYAARTGPAAAATSAAVPSSTAMGRIHRPGDIPGPPPAGTGVLAGGVAAGGRGEWAQSRGRPFTRAYSAGRRGRRAPGGPFRAAGALPPVSRGRPIPCYAAPVTTRRVVAKPVQLRHSPATVTAVHATAEVRSPAPRQSRTNPREKGAGRHDPDRLTIASLSYARVATRRLPCARVDPHPLREVP